MGPGAAPEPQEWEMAVAGAEQWERFGSRLPTQYELLAGEADVDLI